MEPRKNPGFSLPLTLIFIVIFVALFIIFGWVVLPIAVGIFLFITASLAIHDWTKRLRSHKYRPLREDLAIDSKSSRLNFILYRAIFNRSEEQAKAIAEDINERESLDSIEITISEIQKELNTPSLRLADLHPYAGNPTEDEIRAFLTLVLQEIKDKREPRRPG
jgi:hypothetical protein